MPLTRSVRPRLLHLLLVFVLLPWRSLAQTAALPAQPAARSPELITSALALRKLERSVAATGLPARVRGVVTFAAPRENGSFIIDDGETGIYVAATDAAARGLPPPERDFDGPVDLGMVL